MHPRCDGVSAALENRSYPQGRALPSGSVCTIHIICRTLAKSILSVRKQEKLRWDPAGWSSPACAEQGMLAPGPGRLLAAGAQPTPT